MSARFNLADVPLLPTEIAGCLPVATRLQQLPLAGLTWENFERLCVRLVKKDPDAEFVQAYGVRGQEQEGIDLYLRKRSNGRYVVWQCKRYQDIKRTDVAKAVRKFLKAFRTGEAGVPIKQADTFILAVTADLSDRNIVNEIERQNKRLRRLKIVFLPRDIQGLSDDLKPYADIVADFFHPSWLEEFCGVKRSTITSEMESAVVQTTLRAAQEGLSSYGNADLDRIRDLWGERREEEALSELEKFQAAATWPLFNSDVKAKAFRIEAGLRLQNGDAASAQKLFAEFKRIAPAANARVLEALLLQHDKGAEAALAFLNQPSTDDEWVFRWNLLLELGRPKEVTDEFAASRRSDIPPGDFSSVLALAQLAQCDVPAADKTIQSALARNPRHATSRYVAAVVDYYWGISTAFRAWQHMIWPVPPPWNLVKRDKISQERRHRAALTFEEIAGSIKAGADELRVWHLACVALNAGDASEPSEVARRYLAENAANVPVLAWATTFNLRFDRANSIVALKQRLDSGKGALQDVFGLLGLLDDTSDFVSFENLLTQYRGMFGSAESEHLWFLHKAQLLVAQSKTAEAIQLVASMPKDEEQEHIKVVLLNLIAERTKRKEDYQLLAKAQEEAFHKNTNAENLLACCRTHRLLQSWGFIAKHATELVRGVSTQSSLEIAAEGLLQARQSRECLELLENYRVLCQGGDWSPFLRQLAAEARRLQGDLPGAISELERAAAGEGDVAVKMQLFQTQLLKGDLPAALQIARSLTQSPNVPLEFLVDRVIPLARHHDPELARELILRVEATPSALPPALEVKLMEEASRAGVESTFHNLVGKLTQQAVEGKGPLKAFTYEEVRQMLIDRQQMAGELWEAYARGEIPVHLLSSGLDVPLAKLLHQAPRDNLMKRQPALSIAVFTRYAGDMNGEPCSLPRDATELFLDVTSFLLLDALGLLATLERTFDQLHVGSSLAHCLEGHLDQLSPQQQPRALARQQVVTLIDETRLGVWEPQAISLPDASPLVPFISDMGADWCKGLSRVQSESGLLIDFLPLHSRGDIHKSVFPPDPFAKAIVSAKQLIHAMATVGWISENEKNKAALLVGSPLPPSTDQIVLRAKQVVHLNSGQAEELASAGVLHSLCERALVTIEASEATRLRQEVSREHGNSELKKEIQRLLTHLSSGIGNGKYQVHVAKRLEPEERKMPLQPTERTLYEAIDFAEQGVVPVCVDDRRVRRHQTIGRAPLCDTWDLLHHLRVRGAINEEVFSEVRSKMRAANVRYLPITTEEILSAVEAAPIQNGGLQETPELTCLRRYAAATLLDYKTLQNPLCDPQGQLYIREGIWVAKLEAATVKVLIDVWQRADVKTDHAELRSDWIYSNLCFDQRLLAELFGYKQPGYSPTDAVAQQIASMFAFGIGLAEPALRSQAIETRRGRYFQWLQNRVLTPLLPNNPGLWDQAAKHLRNTFGFLSKALRVIRDNQNQDDINAQALRLLVGTYVTDLPPELVRALSLTPAELGALALKANAPGVETLGLTFPAADFWEAMARVLRQNHAALWTADRKTKLRLRYGSATRRILIFARGAANTGWGSLNVPFLFLLGDGPKQREKTLRLEAMMFDLDEPRLSEVVQEISSVVSPSERVATRAAYRERSACALYDDVSQSIRDRKSVYIADLLPTSTECLCRHLRLGLTDVALDDFAARLIQRVGWVDTAARVSRLPAPIPNVMIDEWKQLPVTEQSLRIGELKSRLISPIERIWFLELLCHPATTTPGRLDDAKPQLTWLTDERGGLAHSRAMLAAVRWAHLRLGWDAETSKWSAFARLCVAWSHGCAIYRAFQLGNGSPASVEAWFVNNSHELFADLFNHAEAAAHDAANPIHLRSSTLLLKGITSACASLNWDQIRELNVQQKLPLVINERSYTDILDMWADRSLGGNLLRSFLADLPDERLQRAVGDASFNKMFRLQPQAVAEQALEALSKTPQDLKPWFLLNCIVGDRPMYETLRAKISPALRNIDLVEHYKTSPDECHQSILFTSQLAASSRTSILTNKVWEECLRLCAHLAPDILTSKGTLARQQQVAFAIADAAVRLSAFNNERKEGVQKFVGKLTEVIKQCPAFAIHYRSVFDRTLRHLPCNDLAGFPELISLLRALE
jgi:hypothetical protein